MRISDWSSDVCSSDLLAPFMAGIAVIALRPKPGLSIRGASLLAFAGLAFFGIRIAATTVSFHLYDQSWKRELAAPDHVSEGTPVLGLVGPSCRNVWYGPGFDPLPGFSLERPPPLRSA